MLTNDLWEKVRRDLVLYKKDIDIDFDGGYIIITPYERVIVSIGNKIYRYSLDEFIDAVDKNDDIACFAVNYIDAYYYSFE